jgi:hypothetical protein
MPPTLVEGVQVLLGAHAPVVDSIGWPDLLRRAGGSVGWVRLGIRGRQRSRDDQFRGRSSFVCSLGFGSSAEVKRIVMARSDAEKGHGRAWHIVSFGDDEIEE